jgi:hypothetical protein
MTPHPAGHTVTGAPTGSAAHAARPPVPLRRLLAIVAAGALLTALIGLGIAAHLGSTGPATSRPASARLITVSPPARP